MKRKTRKLRFSGTGKDKDIIGGFVNHKIRKCRELSCALWKFTALEGAEKGKIRHVMVPSCWETYPGMENYRGKAVYSREFQGHGNVRLEFKGVSHTARIQIDGKDAGLHYNAYTPFEIIAKGLDEGIHTLTVEADNSFSEASALHVPNDYHSYGGISRGVVLEELGEAYIQWLHFTPLKKGEDRWFGKAELCVCNLSEQLFEGSIKLSLGHKELAVFSVCLEGKETKTFKTEVFPCEDVKEWNPETPELYYVSAILKDKSEKDTDDMIERIGFREIRIEGKDILLNGKKLYIKGLCRHEDHPQFGCALPVSAMQYDLMLVKDLGANSIRTVHYPNDELFLDLCDEQGILVWEENHARGLSEEQMRNPHFEQQCEDCIYEMITAHYNHPSIYIWGILNECASHTEYGKECYKKQYELIQRLDNSRPRSSASCQFKTDICFGLPDVVSYNIYPKWYHETPPKEYLEDLYQWVQTDTEGEGKPFLVTEIGAGAIYGYRNPTQAKWTEEYQADTLEEQITAVFEQEECSGLYLWQFCDTRVSESWFHCRPRTMNNKGIVDEYRRRKLSYQVVKKLFRASAKPTAL